MLSKKTRIESQNQTRTFRDIVNTPFKKLMFGIQLLSYLLIVGSPIIGGVISRFLDLNAAKTGGVIFGVFLVGEILFYGSLAFLGKEIVLFVRDQVKSFFKRRKRKT